MTDRWKSCRGQFGQHIIKGMTAGQLEGQSGYCIKTGAMIVTMTDRKMDDQMMGKVKQFQCSGWTVGGKCGFQQDEKGKQWLAKAESEAVRKNIGHCLITGTTPDYLYEEEDVMN